MNEQAPWVSEIEAILRTQGAKATTVTPGTGHQGAPLFPWNETLANERQTILHVDWQGSLKLFVVIDWEAPRLHFLRTEFYYGQFCENEVIALSAAVVARLKQVSWPKSTSAWPVCPWGEKCKCAANEWAGSG